MSNLAQLLNPAPGSDAPTIATTAHDNFHHQHNRNVSLTSPLEALAIAATTSASTQSSTHPATAPATQSNASEPIFSTSTSRPSSSHISLPIPYPSVQQTPLFSPSFDPHGPNHHQINNSRLSETVDDISRQLPPLRSSASGPADDSISNPEAEMMAGLQENGPNASEQQLPPFQFIHDGQGNTDTRLPHAIPRATITNGHDSTGDQMYPGLTPRKQVSKLETSEESRKVENSHTDTPVGPQNLPQLFQEGGRISAQPDAATEITMKREDSATGALTQEGVPGVDEGPLTAPKLSAIKKQPVAKTEKRVGKKGIASTLKKPPNKKRKLDIDSVDGTPAPQRSATPASSRASKTPAPRNRKQSSATPMQSSPLPMSREAEGDDEEEVDDDEELFCICRKPDDHTWMIGCDGGCEDWFHGRCVKMNERDGNLIDKYICPNCRDNGIGLTTWKPMCRLETCREPARVTGPKPSKYCCDAHGEQYMALRALGRAVKKNEGSKTISAMRKKRKDNFTDNIANEEDDQPTNEMDDDQAYLRGGVLHAGELKALTSGVKNVEEFKRLGEGVLSPPRTTSPDGEDVKMEDEIPHNKETPKVAYTSEETVQLAEMTVRKASLKRRREALDDREKFLGLVRNRAKSVLEELKKKEGTKDICGFDSRLSWSDEEFDNWRASSEGQKALASGILEAPTSLRDDDGDEKMTNGDSGHADAVGKGVCPKKRCERHKQWFKLQQQEIAFEKDDCRQEMRKVEKEQKGVGERAMVRHLEEEVRDSTAKAED